MKCFGCGKEGHTVRACPDRGEPAPPGVGGASGAVDRPGAADHRGPGTARCHIVAGAEWCQRADQEKAFDRVEHNFLWKVIGEEPLIYGARLDVCSDATPGLMAALHQTKTLCLQQLVDAVGPALTDAQELGSLLGIQSVRVAQRILELWRQRLSGKEKSLITEYSRKTSEPDPKDPFPEILLSPVLEEASGPLLVTCNPTNLSLHKADNKTLYRNCVKSMNRRGLSGRPLTAALANLLGVTAHGALVRSRFLDISQMDAPSQFFFGLEKKNGQKKVIHSLRSSGGSSISGSSEIRSFAASFYADLYMTEFTDSPEVSQHFYADLPQVDPEDNIKLEAGLSLAELHAALMSLQNGKAPGIDGLPVDFYKSFWSVLGEDLLEVIMDCLETGRLPLSCRRAVITLLPKKGDLQELKNWRPVSLLCTDYKILSKVLACRLREVMASVIHIDQTYCVPGRLISDNVTLIRDVLEVSSSLAVDTGLISIDQEKLLIGWSECSFLVFREGSGRDVLLSGMLYSLAIEPLLHKLRKDLCGVCFPGCDVHFKLSAYAEDVIVMKKVGRGWSTWPVGVLLSVSSSYRGFFSWAQGPGVETPGLLYSAESRWTGTERVIVFNGLEEGERFVRARFLSQRVYGVDSAEEAEMGTDGLSVLAAAGASVVRWTLGYSGLGRACAVKKVPYCK
ncbi:hypothetical protein L3Q82_011348, partial [Scortum barcoo]